MSLRRIVRPYFWMGALLLISVMRPTPAYAVPVVDWNLVKHNSQHLVERMAEMYTQVKLWRDASVLRANTAIARTNQLADLRRQYESMAMGELGRIGDYVPDWRDFSNFCSVDVKGVTVCDADNQLMQKYEDVVAARVLDFKSKALLGIGTAEDSINAIILGGTTGALEKAFAHTANSRLLTAHPFIVGQAQRGAQLDQTATNLQAQIDTIIAQEIEGKSISSGRAAQLNASLAYMSAMVDLEVTRNKLEAMQLTAAETGEMVLDYRFDNFASSEAQSRW